MEHQYAIRITLWLTVSRVKVCDLTLTDHRPPSIINAKIKLPSLLRMNNLHHHKSENEPLCDLSRPSPLLLLLPSKKLKYIENAIEYIIKEREREKLSVGNRVERRQTCQASNRVPVKTRGERTSQKKKRCRFLLCVCTSSASIK